MPAESRSVEIFVAGIQDLPSLPSIVQEVIKSASEDSDNFAQIARWVEKDAGLSAKILRIANSAYYSRPGRSSNVQAAITQMGTEEFKMVAVSAALMNTFGRLDTIMDMRAFWGHCLASALACRLVSQPGRWDAEGGMSENPFYMAGLLHHVGILAEAIQAPTEFIRARAWARENGKSLAEAERLVFGFDHAEVGSALLSRWNLPDDVCDAALYHLRPDTALRNARTAQVVHLSAMLCHALNPKNDSFEGIAPWFSEKAFFGMGWDHDQLPTLTYKLGECIRRANAFREAVMDPGSATQVWQASAER